MGYDYSWYLRGPHCAQLAAVGYALSKPYHRIPRDESTVFLDGDVQGRFERLKRFVRGRESDNDFLEVAASLHMLKKARGLPRDEIVEKVLAKVDRFTPDQCDRIWKEMEEWGLMRWAWGRRATRSR